MNIFLSSHSVLFFLSVIMLFLSFLLCFNYIFHRLKKDIFHTYWCLFFSIFHKTSCSKDGHACDIGDVLCFASTRTRYGELVVVLTFNGWTRWAMSLWCGDGGTPHMSRCVHGWGGFQVKALLVSFPRLTMVTPWPHILCWRHCHEVPLLEVDWKTLCWFFGRLVLIPFMDAFFIRRKACIFYKKEGFYQLKIITFVGVVATVVL
jgi:hypothetical protein